MKYVRYILFVFCLVVFLFSGYKLFTIFSEYKQGTDVYTEAANNVYIEKNENAEITPEIIEQEENVTSKQEYVSEEIISLDVDWNKFNDSVIGWISIENNEVINYPVIQSTDNEYYLHHLYDGTYNSSGSIFVDYRNDGFNNRHVIIYGHNMKNGSMFSSIKKYQKQDYADEHRYIYIATPDGTTRVFYVYSCHLTDALGDSDGFSAYQISFDGEEWKEWLNKSVERSLITSEIDLLDKCNIITLSTCMSRGIETERCVIHAVEVSNKQLIEVE